MAAAASFDEESIDDNPLLQDFEFPPFDVLQPKHIRPGIRELLKKLEHDLIKLELSVEPFLVEPLELSVEALWTKFVVPLEKIVNRLSLVWNIVIQLKLLKDSPELSSAIEEVQPEVVKFDLRLNQSKTNYNAFKAIRKSHDWETLSDARKRVVECQMKIAILNGVELENNKRVLLSKIEQDLTRLSQKFVENVTEDKKKFDEKLIIDKNHVVGFAPTFLELFAQRATFKGHENANAENGPWILTLEDYYYAENRSLREEMFCAYNNCASAGVWDNTKIIDGILKLRLEKAKLLNYKNYAEVSMLTKVATLEEAKELLEKLRSAYYNVAVQELEYIKRFCKECDAQEADDLKFWDLRYWINAVRDVSCTINEESMAAYLSLPTVLDGLFNLTKTLFGISIEQVDHLASVWHDDVKFYCVKDSSHNPIAYFYLDPYARPYGKTRGTWMTGIFGQNRVMSCDRLPIAFLVYNLTPPVGRKPSLLSFKEVVTVFHEFGHSLQHMLTKQDESLVAGIQGIELDAAEFSSQFMEKWCYHKNIFKGIAKHYENGKSLHEFSCFNFLDTYSLLGSIERLNQIRFAIVDLELHTNYVPGGSESIFDFYRRVSKGTHVVPLLPGDSSLCSCLHIFEGSYAAGYYSYKWSEVMSADAFSAFEEAGLNQEEDEIVKGAMTAMGPKFRDTILALGGGKAPKEVFRDFRGRNPLPKALLRSIRVRCPPESSSVSSAFSPESSSESSPESSHQLKRRSESSPESLHQQRRRI